MLSFLIPFLLSACNFSSLNEDEARRVFVQQVVEDFDTSAYSKEDFEKFLEKTSPLTYDDLFLALIIFSDEQFLKILTVRDSVLAILPNPERCVLEEGVDTLQPSSGFSRSFTSGFSRVRRIKIP